MNTQNFVNAVILKATGKATSIQPGIAKYEKVIGMANAAIDEYQNMPNVDWNSTYDPKYEIGMVDISDSYPIPDSIKKISSDPDARIILKKAGQDDITYRTVIPQLLYEDTRNVCAIVGRKIVFPHAFSTDDLEFGTQIYAPIYLYLDRLKSTSGEAATPIPVGIEPWLVIRTAAEYSRSDTLKQNQFGNLLAEANQLMTRMISDNEASQQPIYVGGNWSPFTGGL